MKLKVKGFRARNLDLELPRIAVLSGKVGTGKTNILEAAEFAISGNVARRGTSPTALMDVTADGAEAWLGPHGHRIDHKEKVAKATCIGEPGEIRALFTDIGTFLGGSDSERAKAMDGLISYDVAAAQAAGREAAQEELTKGGVHDVTLTSLEKLEADVKEAASEHKRAKATMEQLLSHKPDNPDDPEELAIKHSDAQQQLATFQAMDRDARIQQDQIARAQEELERYSDWTSEAEAQLRATPEPGVPPIRPSDAAMREIGERGRKAVALKNACATQVCPILGVACAELGEKATEAAREAAKLKSEYLAAQAEFEAANAKAEAEIKEWGERKEAYESAQKILQRWGADPGTRIAELKEQLRTLTAVRPDREAMEAIRAQVDGLAIRLERARQDKANMTLLRQLQPKALEAKAQVLRAAVKAWREAAAAKLAESIEPVEQKLTEALGLPVKLRPDAGWRGTAGDRAISSLSGGQRLVFWAALMTAIAREQDVLLCEGAEAGERIQDVVDLLRDCRAQQIIITTHQELVGALTPEQFGGQP